MKEEIFDRIEGAINSVDDGFITGLDREVSYGVLRDMGDLAEGTGMSGNQLAVLSGGMTQEQFTSFLIKNRGGKNLDAEETQKVIKMYGSARDRKGLEAAFGGLKETVSGIMQDMGMGDVADVNDILGFYGGEAAMKAEKKGGVAAEYAKRLGKMVVTDDGKLISEQESGVKLLMTMRETY
jgi:hypothetical protein